MDQDAAWTRLFGQPVFAQQLVRLAVPELVRWLDFSTLAEVPTRWALARQPTLRTASAYPSATASADSSGTASAYSSRTGDRAWRLRYGDGSGRSLMLPTEFQSDTDSHMDVRSREYGMLGYQSEKLRQPDRDGSLRVVPVVIYAGGASWAASFPAWAQSRAGVTVEGEPWLLARASCVLLDADSCRRDDSGRERNLVAELLQMNMLTRLEQTVEALAGMAARLREELPHAHATTAISELVDWWAVCSKHAVTPEQVAHARQRLVQGSSEEMMALARTAREWPRIWREEGRQEGRRDGQAALLRARMVRKFGEGSAAALVRRLERVEDTGVFVEVDEWISECETAEELLERLDRLFTP